MTFFTSLAPTVADPETRRALLLMAEGFGEDVEQRVDHRYEPGAYGVCLRCGQERHPDP